MTSDVDSLPFTSQEVDRAMRTFSSISSELVASYRTLSERAEHVEAELSVANDELARKVTSSTPSRATSKQSSNRCRQASSFATPRAASRS